MKIAELAKTHGVKNLRFRFPSRPLRQIGPIGFTSSQDDQVVVEAFAEECFNRVVADNYKMILVPIDKSFAYRDFYISDFESLCRSSPDKYSVTVVASDQ